MSKVQELAMQLAMTVTGIVWALAGGDAYVAEQRAREILDTTHDTMEMRRKVEEYERNQG